MARLHDDDAMPVSVGIGARSANSSSRTERHSIAEHWLRFSGAWHDAHALHQLTKLMPPNVVDEQCFELLVMPTDADENHDDGMPASSA